ncbi:pesticin [Arthrospira sp. O9.13F]|nr:pesticin [Arthrospira sp. O9.13F]
MKTELKAKFLQHISQKKRDGGFTLIELLVVIIIIGILSAIALPSFLNQANKARQSEARTYVGSINRAQQAHFMERGNQFASEIAALGLGIQSSTENYTYTLLVDNAADDPSAAGRAESQDTTLLDFAGFVWVGDTEANERTTLAILCESETGTTQVTDAAPGAGAQTADGSCPDGWRRL